MTINEAQDEVIEEFNDFTDWMDKYQLLIDLGGELNATTSLMAARVVFGFNVT